MDAQTMFRDRYVGCRDECSNQVTFVGVLPASGHLGLLQVFEGGSAWWGWEVYEFYTSQMRCCADYWWRFNVDLRKMQKKIT